MQMLKAYRLALFILLSLLSSITSAVNLSGTIYGGPTILEGATVTLLSADQAEVGTRISDSSGKYLFQFLAAGTYYIVATPPAGSTFAPNYPEKIQLTDSDLNHNVVLLSAALKLSGYVRDLNGNAIENAYIYIYDQASSDQVGSYLRADSTGYYEIGLSAGTYKFAVYVYKSSSKAYPGAPYYFSSSYIASNTNLTQDKSLDLKLPLVLIRGQTVDPSGAPVAGVEIKTRESGSYTAVTPATSHYIEHGYGSAVSDADGNYAMALFPFNNYTLTLFPPLSRTDIGITAIAGFAISGAMNDVDLVVKDKHTLSGYVRDAMGNAIDGARIKIYDQASSKLIVDNLSSNSDGYYKVNLATGSYKFFIEFYRSSTPKYQGLPSVAYEYYIQPNTTINADTSLDLVTSFVQIKGRTVDSSGNPVAGVEIATVNYGNTTTTPVRYYYLRNVYRGTVSDANGNYVIALFPDNDYILSLIPPSTRPDLGLTVKTNFAVTTAKSNVDLAFAESYVVSGDVRDVSGDPIHNTQVSAYDQATGRELGFRFLTNENGVYQTRMAAGSYKFELSVNRGNSKYSGAPNWSTMQFQGNNTIISGTTDLDLEFPFARVTGRTVDGNGVPVPKVMITTKEGFYNTKITPQAYQYVDHDYGSVTSATDGQYIMALFPYSNYTLTIIPPAGSGFAQTPIKGFKIAEDMSQTIVLALPDKTPPIIIVAPIVTNIATTSAIVEWQTNEPATSIVGGDVAVTRSGYYTAHAVQLINLTPSTKYTITASSTDKSGNGPVTSSPVAFTTLSESDTKAPLIIAGPIVTNITNNSAIVEWETNEVASGTVNYGVGNINSTTAQSGTSVLHQVKLTGLSASTLYNYRVSSTDLAGNGPTASATLNFTTKDNPDTLPPLIIQGPIFTNITHNSVIVSWHTDEPATSGVSYNDGTKFDLISDDTLVTQHQVQVTGLTPDTLYTFTVSSRDAVGNGPVLSTPEKVRTLKLPDTQPPIFIEGLSACTVNHQLVRLCWRNDEPTSALVEYGTSAALLDRQEGKSQLIENHSIPVTGLDAATVYYFRVTATDSSGNKAVSEIFSVKTTSIPNNKAPAFTTAPKVTYLGRDRAVVEWQTDKLTSGMVECSSSGDTVQASTYNKPGKQSVTLTNLQANSNYDCQVTVTDDDGLVSKAVVGGQ